MKKLRKQKIITNIRTLSYLIHFDIHTQLIKTLKKHPNHRDEHDIQLLLHEFHKIPCLAKFLMGDQEYQHKLVRNI